MRKTHNKKMLRIKTADFHANDRTKSSVDAYARINVDVNNIYKEQELSPKATVKEYLTVRKEGSREVKRRLDYYNLDMIISVGYRIKSHVATRFEGLKLILWRDMHL